MENRKTSFIRFPSGRKKRVIKTQNALVSSFIREKFEVEPFLVSRDKANHIVVIVLDEGGNRLIAFLLGTDGSKKPTLLTAGKLFFKRENEKEIFVPLFKVINDYKGSGIGTLLLRSFENYAAGEGCSQISLCSLLSASKLKSIHKPEDETGNGLKYLTYPSGKLKKKYSNYFDKNLYFYYSNGFEMIDDPTIAGYDRDNIPLAKKPIHEVDLQYGVRGKKYLESQPCT